MKTIIAVETSKGIKLVDSIHACIGKKSIAVWTIDEDGYVSSLGEKGTTPSFILTGGEDPMDEVESMLFYLNRGHIPFDDQMQWSAELCGYVKYPVLKEKDGWWDAKSSDTDPASDMGLEMNLS